MTGVWWFNARNSNINDLTLSPLIHLLSNSYIIHHIREGGRPSLITWHYHEPVIWLSGELSVRVILVWFTRSISGSHCGDTGFWFSISPLQCRLQASVRLSHRWPFLFMAKSIYFTCTYQKKGKDYSVYFSYSLRHITWHSFELQPALSRDPVTNDRLKNNNCNNGTFCCQIMTQCERFNDQVPWHCM